MDVPPVLFARSQGVSLAYQIWGQGPPLVTVPPAAQNIELAWERPEYRALYQRLGSFCRHVHFDKRGTGASDRTVAIPSLDERIEDLAAVMDDAQLDRAFLMGVSEGGPVALAFAAAYPERVNGVVILCSGARMFGDPDTSESESRRQRWVALLDRWGTEDTMAIDVWAPSLAGDESYRAWEPRYERQSASPAAMRDLFGMITELDVRPLLGEVAAPTLVLHRRHDPVLPVERAVEVAEGVPGARLVVVEGRDHWAHIGGADLWLDQVEAFVTGAVRPRDERRPDSAPVVSLRTMGGFAVVVDGLDQPLTVWGSRQARQLCKRLAVAVGEPVRRDELLELLWPDEPDPTRLGPRLSVLLSNVRRVLRGGIVSDRAAVRLDPRIVPTDLYALYEAADRGDDGAAATRYRGPVLPEDLYDDWVIVARDRLARTVIGARRRLAAGALNRSCHDEVADHATAIIDIDPFDERAHELLVQALAASGQRGAATRANDHYRARMAELGVRPRDLL